MDPSKRRWKAMSPCREMNEELGHLDIFDSIEYQSCIQNIHFAAETQEILPGRLRLKKWCIHPGASFPQI